MLSCEGDGNLFSIGGVHPELGEATDDRGVTCTHCLHALEQLRRFEVVKGWVEVCSKLCFKKHQTSMCGLGCASSQSK